MPTIFKRQDGVTLRGTDAAGRQFVPGGRLPYAKYGEYE